MLQVPQVINVWVLMPPPPSVCPSVQKLQLVLAPVSSFFPLSLDEGWSEKTTLLSHSFQQLDRIDSLSEQIGFLEERIGTCEGPSIGGRLFLELLQKKSDQRLCDRPTATTVCNADISY